MNEPLLTSRQLADAMGVSESSLKRWADDGRLRAWRTEGGHRRFALRDALQFVRRRRAPLVRPEILGVGAPAGNEGFVTAALAGDADRARELLVARFASGESIASLCDGPIKDALARVGELWKHDPAGIYVEHRMTAVCVEVLAALRAMMPAPTGALVIGGSAPGDPYAVTSMMCAATLIDVGLRATNLGADTPVDSLLRAAGERPALVWLSIMAPPPPVTIAAVSELAAELARREVPLVIGGRWADTIPGPARRGASMAELAAIAATVV
jgi:excisionase family DNA binding protein